MTNTNDKGVLGDIARVARNSAEELVDRARAVGHDVAARIGQDEAENAQDRAAAQAARTRADASKQTYEADMTRLNGQANAQLSDTAAKVRAAAADIVDRAKAQAQRKP